MMNPKINKMSAIAVMFLVIGSSTLALADRTIKQQGRAVYPELAKKMSVTGTVKVEVKVAPNGSVVSAHAIGGHPLLIDAAVQAAKNTKFAPGEESTETITFNFTNNNN